MYSLAEATTVKADWGHSSNVVGVELCQLAGVAHLCLFHHEPASDDARDRGGAGGHDKARGDHAPREADSACPPPTTGWKSGFDVRRRGRRAGAAPPADPVDRRGAGRRAGVLMVLAHPRWIAPLSEAWFDAYQRAVPARGGSDAGDGGRDRRAEPRRVRSLALAAIAAGRSPAAGRTALRPAAIGVDILMPEPDPLSPERLLQRRGPDTDRAASRAGRRCPTTTSLLARALSAAPSVLAVAGMPERDRHGAARAPVRRPRPARRAPRRAMRRCRTSCASPAR